MSLIPSFSNKYLELLFVLNLRLRRICSKIKDLKSHVKELKGWFLRRGYLQRIAEEQMDGELRLSLKHDTQQNKIESGIPLVVTYNPPFRNLSTTLQKNFNILYSDVEVRMVFTRSPFVAYKSARNLQSFLIRSKVCPLERTAGSSKCSSKRHQVCLNVSETDIFEPFQTKEQHNINHHLDCSDKCLIYLLSGLQHLGTTTDRFLLIWGNYKDNDTKAERGEEHMQPELFEHFHSEKHNVFLQDSSITLIDKTNGSDPTRREEYWRVVLKTVAPYGLNRIE